MSDSVSHVAFQAPELEEVTALFPNYDIHRLIACGGMGAVYHGTQCSLDRDVAIKILPREFSQDAEFRAGFETEAKAMAKLNHPNLIGVYDFGDAAGLLYIVMEYVSGSSLYAVSHGRVVHQDDALKMVIDVCRGLAHAHQYGILHRDIKPSNILMDGNANPKIGDFGLASSLGKQIQEGEQIFGTPGYTAPEVIDPPHVFDHRADIFSVGVMLQEMLTGIAPTGERPVSAMPQVGNLRLRAVIQRATHPDPNSRYASADELAVELEKIAATAHNPLLAATAATRTVRPYTPRKVVPKSSSSGGGFLILLLLAVAAAVYVLVVKPRIDAADSGEDGISNSQPGAQNQKPVRRQTAAEQGLRPNDNIEAFFTRVEGVMKGRIRGDLNTYRQALKLNVDEFESESKTVITMMNAAAAAPIQSEFNVLMGSVLQQNHVLPDTLPGSLGQNAAIQQIFLKAHANQSKFKSEFQRKLNAEQDSYIRGLEKQIDRYRDDNDPVAAQLLEKEITRLKSEPGYYEFIISQ